MKPTQPKTKLENRTISVIDYWQGYAQALRDFEEQALYRNKNTKELKVRSNILMQNAVIEMMKHYTKKETKE